MTDPRELWAKLPATVIFDSDLTLADLRVYAYLDFRAGTRGWWIAKAADIADALDLSLRSVRYAVTHLRDRGHLLTERKRTAIRYTIPARQKGNPLPITDDENGNPLHIRSATGCTSGRAAQSSGSKTSDPRPQTGRRADPFEHLIQREFPEPDERRA